MASPEMPPLSATSASMSVQQSAMTAVFLVSLVRVSVSDAMNACLSVPPRGKSPGWLEPPRGPGGGRIAHPDQPRERGRAPPPCGGQSKGPLRPKAATRALPLPRFLPADPKKCKPPPVKTTGSGRKHGRAWMQVSELTAKSRLGNRGTRVAKALRHEVPTRIPSRLLPPERHHAGFFLLLFCGHALDVPGGHQPVPAAHGAGGASPGAALPRRRRGGRPPPGDEQPALRGEGVLRVPLLRHQDVRPHPGGEHRPDEGGAEVRPGQGHPPHLLRGVVDPRVHPELHPQELEPGEAGHHPGAATAVLLAGPDAA